MESPIGASRATPHRQSAAHKGTSLSASQYGPAFVARYDLLVDWELRMSRELPFLLEVLHAHKCRSILDVAAGTGHHAVALAERGFRVRATDGSSSMVRAAEQTIRAAGVDVQVAVADWRSLSGRLEGGFDALLCLGNSFPHLLTKRHRREAMNVFFTLLRRGGVLFLDHRNYHSLLVRAGPDEITLRNNYYCASDVSVSFRRVGRELIELAYRFGDGSTERLRTFPLTTEETISLMESAGFMQVASYPDYGEAEDGREPSSIVEIGIAP